MPSAEREQTRDVTVGPIGLQGALGVPQASGGIVLFAHGSGSGRFSPRNNFVAHALRQAGLATLLLDLLTEAEAQDRRNVFDIPLLARRLLLATAWVKQDRQTATLPLGYFGASTGAAAALVAAAPVAWPIAAIVSRGGRPDLAGPALAGVTAPTLLIVGGADLTVLELNRAALAQRRCSPTISRKSCRSSDIRSRTTRSAACDRRWHPSTNHGGGHPASFSGVCWTAAGGRPRYAALTGELALSSSSRHQPPGQHLVGDVLSKGVTYCFDDQDVSEAAHLMGAETDPPSARAKL